MKSWPFWIVAALVLGIVAHLGYVLIGPSLAMQRMIGEAETAADLNRFILLSPARQALLLGENEREAISGQCAFDISQGDLAIDAEMPDSLWSLTVYSQTGDNLYAINDRQAGTNKFRLILRRAPSLLDLFTLDPAETGTFISDGWSVEVPEPRGIAVFWAALNYPELRPGFAEMMKRSICTLEADG